MKHIKKPTAVKQKTLKDVLKVGDRLQKDHCHFDGRTYIDDGTSTYEVTKINRVTFEAKDIETGDMYKFDEWDAANMLRATGRFRKVEIYETIYLN